jgi:hypothetical protein
MAVMRGLLCAMGRMVGPGFAVVCLLPRCPCRVPPRKALYDPSDDTQQRAVLGQRAICAQLSLPFV